MLKKYYAIWELNNNDIIPELSAETVREILEERLMEKFGFVATLQESEDEGFLEIYIHSDTYEELSDVQLETLSALGMSEENSLEAICKALDLFVPENVEVSALTQEQQYKLISYFFETYYNIEEETDRFSKEYFYVTGNILVKYLPTRLAYLELSEIIDDIENIVPGYRQLIGYTDNKEVA